MSASVTDAERLANRSAFLSKWGIAPHQAILVHLRYEGDDYLRYSTVSADMAGNGVVTSSTVVADALFTTEKKLALLLPIADCIAAVLFDPEHQAIGLAHLGRHNLEQQGGTSVVDYMVANFGTDPRRLHVFLSAAAGSQSYPLYDFDNRSLHEVATEQLVSAGVQRDVIDIDSRDTTRDMSLYSHSEFLKGNRPTDGRQAVVCMMRD